MPGDCWAGGVYGIRGDGELSSRKMVLLFEKEKAVAAHGVQCHLCWRSMQSKRLR